MQTWYQLSPPQRIDIVGYVNTTNSHPKRSNMAYWTLVFVEKGQRTLLVNGSELRAGAREYLLLPPDSLHEPLENDEHSAYFIHFHATGTAITHPKKMDTEQILLPACGKLPNDFNVLSYVHYLHRQFPKPYAGTAFCLAQLQSLLHILSFHAQLSSFWFHGPSARCEKILEFIENNTDITLHAKDYETAFGLSYHQLNRLFKQQFSCTLKQYHHHARMQRAAALLLEGNSAQQTAKLCGYEDYYFFIRCFKTEYSVAPGGYLRNNNVEF